MDQNLTIESQGPSLPPRRFASTRFHALLTTAGPRRRTLLTACAPLLIALPLLHAQQQPDRAARTQQFLAQRATAQGKSISPALALVRARAQHLALQQQQSAGPLATANLTTAWQPLGPSSIVSPTYNHLTGRITAIAADPNDATGNTVYLGTTGGGVWKSTNAAGPLSDATFAPLTDTLPGFSANAGSGIIASLSIGAVAVQPTVNPVVIAGTGDPNDATDSLYGEGLLIYSTASQTWTLVQQSEDGVSGNHSFIGLSTAAIAFSTATPTLVVAAFSTSPQATVVDAATGDSFPGLYYSTNSGQTWQMASIYDGTTVVQQPQPLGASETGNAVTSVVWDAQRSMFFAAVRAHGYYSSPNGVTWTRLLTQPGSNLTTANCPVGSTGTGDQTTCPIFRGTLAVQPATGDLYALTVDVNNLDQGLWQDLCNATSTTCATPAPTFANRIDNGALEVGGGSTVITQGNYNLALNAAPAAANTTFLYAGTVDLYRCAIAAGSSACSLRNTTNALDGCDAPAQVAPAQHAITTIAQSDGIPLLYLGNDSGLWRSLDGVAETGSVCSSTDNSHFNNLNPAIGAGGSLAELIGFAQNPTTSNTLIAGLGANGSAATSTASALTPWPQLSAGEGGFPSIDPNTPANWYVAIGAGVNFVFCPLGTDCAASDFIPPSTIGESQVDQDISLLDAPTQLDPQLTTSLLIGTCRVWRGPAASGSAWSLANALSPALGGITTPCSAESPLIRSLGAGGPNITGSTPQSSGSQVLYAGISGIGDGGGAIPGHLFVTASANTATSSIPWTDAALSPVTNDTSDANLFNPSSFDISSIAVDPHDATGATAYATIMGFGVPHLYRTTNFGASWLNVSANLPDAPANAVVIDPNSANTIYIAMDTGVYVTQAITSCGTTPPTNCWSVLGTSLPNSPVVTLAAAASLPTGDGRIGELRAGTYGRGLWQTPLLTATVTNSPAITLSAASLTFAPQQVGTQSASQTLTVTSTGSTPVVFSTLVIAGDFTETDDCAGQTMAVNSSCTVQLIFAPAATGALSGQLTLYANVPGGQATVALNGTGTAPASIVLTPLSLTFLATIVNQPSAAQIITVANTGGNTATLQPPVILGEPGDFSINANTCGTTLPTQTSCSISILFTPTASGARSATLSITDSAGTQTASLSGIGNAPATDTLAPLSLTFAQQQIGTTSPAQTITLTNSGGVPLTLIAASLSPGDFSVVNACGNSLAPHSTCALNVTFSPTAIRLRTATLTLTDQFRFQTIPITGTGIAGPGVSLAPVSLIFPATGVGLTALPQTFTLTNNGGLPLAISSLAATPGFILGANTCGTSLAVDAACTLTIVFAPTTPGTLSGTLSFTDNAPSGTQIATLSGTGIDFSLTSIGVTTNTLPTSGGSATYPMQLTSLASLTGNIALTCTGAPANSTCNVVPAVVSLGTTTLIAVTLETDVASTTTASSTKPSTPSPRPFTPHTTPFTPSTTILLALLLPLALITRRRRLPQLALLAALTCTLALLSGCGTSRIIPTATTGGITATTAPGTYTLTVSASAAGLTHSVNLTLVVQN
jgi:hypothetical protein